jgi:hypothetical protein
MKPQHLEPYESALDTSVGPPLLQQLIGTR